MPPLALPVRLNVAVSRAEFDTLGWLLIGSIVHVGIETCPLYAYRPAHALDPDLVSADQVPKRGSRQPRYFFGLLVRDPLTGYLSLHCSPFLLVAVLACKYCP